MPTSDVGAIVDLAQKLKAVDPSRRSLLRDLSSLLCAPGAKTSRAFDLLLMLLRHPDMPLADLTGQAATALLRSGAALQLPTALDADCLAFIDFGAASRMFSSLGLKIFAGLPEGARQPFDPSKLHILVHADLPDTVPDAAANTLPRANWWHMWTAITLLQGLSLHVSAPSGHDLGPVLPGSAATKDGWDALEDVDPDLGPLISAMRAAGLPAPDVVGHDLMDGTRVVTNAELAWTAPQVGLSFADAAAPGWTLVSIDPDDTDPAHIAGIVTTLSDHLAPETAS